MSNVLTLARRLAKLDPQERRLAASIGNELAGDGRRKRRKKKPVTSSPKPKPPKKAPAPKAAAPRVRPRLTASDIEDDD